MTNDIFYVFQHTCGSNVEFEHNNLLKNTIFYDYIENTIIFALK